MMYWALVVAMETAVPSYLSLDHKQALASNVISVNRERESDEQERPLLFFQFEWGFVWIIYILFCMLWVKILLVSQS